MSELVWFLTLLLSGLVCVAVSALARSSITMDTLIDICTSGMDNGSHYSGEQSIWMLGREYDGVDRQLSVSQRSVEMMPVGNRKDIRNRRGGSERGAEDETSTPGKRSYGEFLQDLRSRIWCTYRRDFSCIAGSPYTSDVGWGCMHRNWRLDDHDVPPEEYYRILQLVEDSPRAPFSIHKIALQGNSLSKQVGQWFGPSTAIVALSQLHELQQLDHEFSMYLADDSMIYLDALYAKCRSTPSSPSSSSSAAQSEMTQPFRPVLILIPVRIGLEKPNDIYIPALREVFQYRQCIGIIGGRPRASLYFIAAQEISCAALTSFQGDTLLYLDPHFPQQSVDMSNPPFSNASYHSTVIRRINMKDCDPSMAVAFFCSSRKNLNDFVARSREIMESSDSFIFGIQDNTPAPRSEDHPVVVVGDDDLDDFVAL